MGGVKASWLKTYLGLNEAGALPTIAPPKFGTGEGEEVVGLIAPPRFGVVEVSALRGSTDSGVSAGMKAGMKAVGSIEGFAYLLPGGSTSKTKYLL